MSSKKVLIIAEAGVNHNGSIKLAKKLIDVAVKAKADIVKFQTFTAENLVIKNAKKADYQKEKYKRNESQFEMLKKLELNIEDHKELILYCKSKDIIFLSSPFDLKSINLLNKLGLKIIKIPSSEITNFSYLGHIGKLKKKVILSTGMANMREIADALKVLTDSGTKKKDITILHANTAYPTPMKDVNLKAMHTIGNKFKTAFGYSDHTLGTEVCIAAVAMGATCIEKHFTLDRNMRGPDHKASLEPNELIAMVKSVRNIELASGNGLKIPSKSEKKNIKVVRKSLFAFRDIKKGEIFTEQNLIAKRPGYGLSPFRLKKLLGKKSLKRYKKNQIIK